MNRKVCGADLNWQ